MPLVKAKQLMELSAEELVQRLQRLRKEQHELGQKKEIGQLDRPSRFGHIRREIAQILTELLARQLSAEKTVIASKAKKA